MSTYFIEAFGVKRAQTQFSRISIASSNMAPAWRTISELIFAIEEQIFLSQGRRGGGSWRRLTADWMERKFRERKDPRINIATGALMDSLTQRGDPNMILELHRNFMVFGSSLPYAATTQRNRPVVKWTVNDRARMRAIMRDYLVAAWKAVK